MSGPDLLHQQKFNSSFSLVSPPSSLSSLLFSLSHWNLSPLHLFNIFLFFLSDTLNLLFAYYMIRIACMRLLSIDQTKSGAERDYLVVFARPSRGSRLVRIARDRKDRLSIVIALGRKTSPSGLRYGSELCEVDTIQEVRISSTIMRVNPGKNITPGDPSAIRVYFNVSLSIINIFFKSKPLTCTCIE